MFFGSVKTHKSLRILETPILLLYREIQSKKYFPRKGSFLTKKFTKEIPIIFMTYFPKIAKKSKNCFNFSKNIWHFLDFFENFGKKFKKSLSFFLSIFLTKMAVLTEKIFTKEILSEAENQGFQNLQRLMGFDRTEKQ